MRRTPVFSVSAPSAPAPTIFARPRRERGGPDTVAAFSRPFFTRTLSKARRRSPVANRDSARTLMAPAPVYPTNSISFSRSLEGVAGIVKWCSAETRRRAQRSAPDPRCGGQRCDDFRARPTTRRWVGVRGERQSGLADGPASRGSANSGAQKQPRRTLRSSRSLICRFPRVPRNNARSLAIPSCSGS